MARIHHATIKRATRLGVELIEADGAFRLVRIEDGALSVDTFDSTAEALESMEQETVEFETEEETHAGGKCGVMAKSYHDVYSANPHGPGCGDTIDIEMRNAIMVPDISGKGQHADPYALRAIGENAGLWLPRWDALNIGMRRMNLANRIRGLLRNDSDAQVTIGDTTGRFGVSFQPSKRKARKAKVAA